jgi:hypothetical protein
MGQGQQIDFALLLSGIGLFIVIADGIWSGRGSDRPATIEYDKVT